MFIYSMVLRCAGTLKTWIQSGPVTVEMTTTVVHSYNFLINCIKPFLSLIHSPTYPLSLLLLWQIY